MKQDTRSHIIDCAIHLFSERGFQAVTTRSITTASNVSAANLYHHFKDKQSVYDAAVELAVDRGGDRLLQSLLCNGTPVERLRNFFKCVLDFFCNGTPDAKLIGREYLEQGNSHLSHLAQGVLRRPHDALKELIIELSPQRRTDKSAHRIARLLVDTAYGAAHLRSTHSKIEGAGAPTTLSALTQDLTEHALSIITAPALAKSRAHGD